MKNDILEVLVTEEQLRNRVKFLGEQITNDYKDKDLILVSILKGSVFFIVDLARHINLDLKMDFMSVSSYGSSHETSGIVKIIKDLQVDIEKKDILVVEDILDSGNTLNYIIHILKSRNVNSIKVCTLLDKPLKREVDVNIDYLGFVIPDNFVVGYGLDYNERYRNLPYIGSLKPEVYL